MTGRKSRGTSERLERGGGSMRGTSKADSFALEGGTGGDSQPLKEGVEAGEDAQTGGHNFELELLVLGPADFL